MNWRLHLVCTYCAMIVLLGVARAQGPSTQAQQGTTDWDQWKASCSQIWSAPGWRAVENCLTHSFTASPFHLLVQNVAPGEGFGLGGRYTHKFNAGEWQRRLSLTGVGTARGFSFAEAAATFHRPPFGPWTQGDEDFAVRLYARDRKMPQLPFYGLGPDSSLSSLTEFGERDTAVGVFVSNPVANWLNLDATAESLWNSITPGGQGGIAPTSVGFTEQQVPGIAVQPHLIHVGMGVSLHRLAWNRVRFLYLFTYGRFEDTTGGHYSFNRLTVDLRHTFYPVIVDGHRSNDTTLTARMLLSSSRAASGGAVPFYLDPTLGGSNIDDQPTLRAFPDLRFRGPDVGLVQFELDHRIIGPVGAMAFDDVGRAALRFGDLASGRWRNGFGFGVVFYAGARPILRLYAGLGGGEGVHTYFGVPSFLSSAP